MKKHSFFLPIVMFFALPALSLPAIGADDILPPPTKVQDTEESRETIENSGKDTDLNKELSAPDTLPEGAQVRSYTREKDGAEITEYSMHGRVYMIKVQPAGGLPAYYLYDRNGDGSYQRLPGGYKRPSPPTWVIKRF